jgi:4-oxalocrotonate tautomerase
MPVISIKMLEGRSEQQKRQLIKLITENICCTCSCPPDAVTIIIEDVKKQNWGSAGSPKA